MGIVVTMCIYIRLNLDRRLNLKVESLGVYKGDRLEACGRHQADTFMKARELFLFERR